ncbi:MAG: hypothetical protein ABI675_29845 [Chitinophagaceae bacterium]
MNDLQVKYSELFSLSVEQPFYENGICRKFTTDPIPDLQIVPTSECRDLMKRLDFVFRPVARQAGMIVLSHTTINSASDTVLRFPVKPGEKLSFWMVLQNPELLNFNNLPGNKGRNKMYYFSNQVTDGAAPRDDLHLSINSSGVNAAADLIKFSPAGYNFHHTSVIALNTAFVKHQLTGSEVAPKTIVNQSGQSDLSFDLSPLPPGKCKLIISGTERDSFYYAGLVVPSSLFGVIEISLSQTLDVNYRTIEAGNVILHGRPFYTLQFNNRKTLWRYAIVLEKNNPLFVAMQAMNPADKANFISHFKIVTNDTAISFTQSMANDTVFEFISDSVIALQEKYISSSIAGKGLCLTLKKNEGIAGEAVVRDYLPFPSTSMINTLNDPTIYSDIFLTI